MPYRTSTRCQQHADFVDQVSEATERWVRFFAQARQEVGGGDGGPAASLDRIEAPDVRVASKVGGHLGCVSGEHHRMLVHIDQDEVVHEALEPTLVRLVERHAHRRHASGLGSEGELRHWHLTQSMPARRGAAHYCASKAGLVLLAQTLALELAEHRINVNVVSPGFIEVGLRPGVSIPYRETIKRDIPWGRFHLPSAALPTRADGRLGAVR
jgi:hypothetical protein